jgi:hypothetical protein
MTVDKASVDGSMICSLKLFNAEFSTVSYTVLLQRGTYKLES